MQYDKDTMRRVGIMMEESRIKLFWREAAAKLNKLCLILIYILQFIVAYTATFKERDVH